MPTISATVDIDFDLSDYKSEIESEYCNGNCLKEHDLLKNRLKQYVNDMYKTLYLIIDNERDIKNMEQIMNDLQNILNEY
jgi:hypothetical protein